MRRCCKLVQGASQYFPLVNATYAQMLSCGAEAACVSKYGEPLCANHRDAECMSFEDWDFLEAKRLLKEPAVPASWCESVIAKFDSNVATKPPPPRIPLEKIVWKR